MQECWFAYGESHIPRNTKSVQEINKAHSPDKDRMKRGKLIDSFFIFVKSWNCVLPDALCNEQNICENGKKIEGEYNLGD